MSVCNSNQRGFAGWKPGAQGRMTIQHSSVPETILTINFNTPHITCFNRSSAIVQLSNYCLKIQWIFLYFLIKLQRLQVQYSIRHFTMHYIRRNILLARQTHQVPFAKKIQNRKSSPITNECFYTWVSKPHKMSNFQDTWTNDSVFTIGLLLVS